MNIVSILSVGVGAALGGILRYLISVYYKSSPDKFPMNTFLINLLGSFVLGIIIGYSIKYTISPNLKLFLTVGFCGGFTTFSAFSLEVVQLIQNGNISTAVWYLLASVLGGVLLAWCGMRFV